MLKACGIVQDKKGAILACTVEATRGVGADMPAVQDAQPRSTGTVVMRRNSQSDITLITVNASFSVRIKHKAVTAATVEGAINVCTSGAATEGSKTTLAHTISTAC